MHGNRVHLMAKINVISILIIEISDAWDTSTNEPENNLIRKPPLLGNWTDKLMHHYSTTIIALKFPSKLPPESVSSHIYGCAFILIVLTEMLHTHFLCVTATTLIWLLLRELWPLGQCIMQCIIIISECTILAQVRKNVRFMNGAKNYTTKQNVQQSFEEKKAL